MFRDTFAREHRFVCTRSYTLTGSARAGAIPAGTFSCAAVPSNAVWRRLCYCEATTASVAEADVYGTIAGVGAWGGVCVCPSGLEYRANRTSSTHGLFDFHFSSKIIPIVIPI